MTAIVALAVAATSQQLGCTLDRQGTESSGANAGGSSSSAGPGGSAQSSSQGGAPAGSGGQGPGPTSSSGAGGDCVPTTENCLNGADDDCDNLVDCADQDSCGAFSCLDLPAGATPVQPASSPADCVGDLTPVALADCSQCSCQVNGNGLGACTHIAHLFTTSDCQNSPQQSILVNLGSQSTCTAANTTATAGDTVGARAELTGLGDADCTLNTPTAAATPRYLCTATALGACAGNEVCVPAGALSCLLFAGDAVCPTGYLNKETLFDTSAKDCNCACETTSQTCTASEHYHARDSATCGGNKFDVPASGNCVNTGLTNIIGLQNHNDPPATGAICGGTGDSSMAAGARTLCCP